MASAGLPHVGGPSPHDDDVLLAETRDDGWRRENVRGACRYAHIHTRSDTRAGVGQPHLVHSTDGLSLRCIYQIPGIDLRHIAYQWLTKCDVSRRSRRKRCAGPHSTRFAHTQCSHVPIPECVIPRARPLLRSSFSVLGLLRSKHVETTTRLSERVNKHNSTCTHRASFPVVALGLACGSQRGESSSLRGIAGAPADATNTVLTSPMPPILLTGGPLRLAAHGLCPPSGWGPFASRDPNAASLRMYV